MKKLLFVFNPFSGKAQIKNHLLEIVDTMVKAGYEVTILINDVEIENGAKITYAEATEIVITLKSSDITADVNVSFVVTKTPEVVVPDNEWTNNY